MPNIKPDVPRSRHLSKVETVELARQVMERARLALHEKKTWPDQDRAETPLTAYARHRAETSPQTINLQRPRYGGAVRNPALANRLGAHFDGLMVGCCVTLSASAWIVHLVA